MAKGEQVGFGGAEVMEVLHMDKFEQLDKNPQKQKIQNDDELILQMLMPSQLKAPEMAFIEETDIEDEVQLRASCQELPKAPLTGYQQARKNKKAFEEH